MSWKNKVIWSEGMFLRPQHMQQHDRYLESFVEAHCSAVAPYHWGYASMRLDENALRLGRVALLTGRGILPDYTPFDFPGVDEPPLPLTIPEDARDELVLLVAPLRRLGADEADLAGTDATALTRYRVSNSEVRDSNSGPERSAAIQLGNLRLRFLLKRDVTDAYSCLGVARVTERRPDGQIVLDGNYIAPTLSVRDNTVLAGYVREIQGLLHQRGDALARRLVHPGPGGVAEVAHFLLLQTLNRFEPVFSHMSSVSLLHPERLYATCLFLAGDLSTFSQDDRRPPTYPDYMHDDPARCFTPVVDDLRRSLATVIEPTAIPIELQERQFGVHVAIIRDPGLLHTAGFILAVNAQMSAETLRSRFPNQVKIGPVERIRDLVNLQLPGLELRALPVAPRQIPFHAGYNYFELTTSGELWKQMDESRGIAIHVAGDFPGLEMEFWAIRS